MVHGLLTATVPTKIGGDMNYIARQMTFEFLRPVFVGDSVRVETVVKDAARGDRPLQVAVDFVCCNQEGETVLAGTSRGVVRESSQR